jgi:hypothetical protein
MVPGASGKLGGMEHPRTDAEEHLERAGDELEERLEKLDEHIGEAEKELKARRDDADLPQEDAGGDSEDEPSGAQRGG